MVSLCMRHTHTCCTTTASGPATSVTWARTVWPGRYPGRSATAYNVSAPSASDVNSLGRGMAHTGKGLGEAPVCGNIFCHRDSASSP